MAIIVYNNNSFITYDIICEMSIKKTPVWDVVSIIGAADET